MNVIYRFNCISRIQRTWLRRMGLVVLFIPLLLLNWLLAAVSVVIALPVFVFLGAVKNTYILLESVELRWHTRKDD